MEIRVWPLSFTEFLTLSARGSAGLGGGGEALAASAVPGAPIWDYLRFGGLPGLHELPPDADTRDVYLRDVFNSVLLRDVVSRHGLRDVDLLGRLVAFVASNLGQTFSAASVGRFMKSQGRRLGSETVYRYLGYLEEAFALHRVRRVEVKGKRLL